MDVTTLFDDASWCITRRHESWVRDLNSTRDGHLEVVGKPQAISESEAARILNSKEEAAARPKQEIRVDYEIGDQVKVLDGPFASFNGLVEELDFEKARVKVSVSIFGRATPVELDFEQVERMK